MSSSSNNGFTNVLHAIPPVYDDFSKVLILGSFPSVKSREEHFFYGHPQNRFWRVLAAVYDCDVPLTVEDKRSFLLAKHIALWDVIASCRINGSSDSSIKNVVPNDVTHIMQQTEIKKIFLNGKAAQKYYNKFLRASLGRDAFVLPSTSPANAAWNVEKLTDAWRVIRTDD